MSPRPQNIATAHTEWRLLIIRGNSSFDRNYGLKPPNKKKEAHREIRDPTRRSTLNAAQIRELNFDFNHRSGVALIAAKEMLMAFREPVISRFFGRSAAVHVISSSVRSRNGGICKMLHSNTPRKCHRSRRHRSQGLLGDLKRGSDFRFRIKLLLLGDSTW